MDMVGSEHEKRAAFPLLVASCSGQIITITYLSKTETEDQDFRPILTFLPHHSAAPSSLDHQELVFVSVRLWRLVHVRSIQLCLVLLFPLHTTVLEPYFDLSFCQTECMGYLDSPPASEIPIEVELLFELESLVAGVRLPSALSLKLTPHPWVER